MEVAHAQERVETLEDIVSRVSVELDFDEQIVRNVIDTETGRTWDCTLKGRDGELGCFQIIPEFHPDVDPLNFEESLRYFISEYKAGRETQWVGCSCVASARLTIPSLPRGPAGGMIPNTTLNDGKIAILDYNGTKHVTAYKVVPTGILTLSEGNFEPCKIISRIITWKELEEHLVGFSNPTPSSLAVETNEKP